MSNAELLLMPRKGGDPETDCREPPLPDEYQIPILYQDSEILIVDKPYDVRIDGNFPVTVEKLVRDGLKIEMDKFRMCNQLDFSTSGAIVLGLSKYGTRKCNKLFSERRSRKWYLAVGLGPLRHPLLHPITVSKKIGPIADDFRMKIDEESGLEAESVIIPIRTDPELGVLFLVKLVTGRRHQIRLHMQYLGYPIVGDATYNDRADEANRMMLHAWKLTLPYKDGKTVVVKAGLFEEWDRDDLEVELERVSNNN